MTSLFKLSLLALAVAAGTAAQAQTAGSWSVRVGATQISPSVTSDDLTAPSFAGTKADVGDASQLGGGVTYMLTNNVALDLPLALPFNHEITGAGAIAGVGKIGETKVLPASLFVQYRFGEPNAKVRPYVGAGPTFARFFKERSTNTLTALTGGTPANPTTLSIENKLAPSIQIGAVFALNDRWFVDVMAAKTFLKTRNTLSTGQTLDIRLNPTTVSLAVGYRY